MEFGAMAQRLSGFARNKPAAAEALAAAATLARAMKEDAPGEIALDLVPLIAPYRRHGRLSLRVERLPHRARLSRGHNNGDRSWSLMSDELDGLTYLPPGGGAPEACTLSIRIISLDGGDGATLALLDYPVVADGLAPPAVAAKPPRHAPEVDQAELRRLRDELARTKSAVADRDADSAELARLRDELEKSKGATAEQESAFRAASSALATETLERNRAAWQEEQSARAAKTQPRAEEPRRQVEAALAKAEKEWKAGEAERLAAARAKWADETGAQLEKIKTRAAAESAREKSDEAERRRLRDEVARLKKSLSAKESELEQAREVAGRDGEAALAAAEKAWRDQETQRFATARAQWQDRSERALAEATTQFERAQAQRAQADARRLQEAEAELEHLRDDLAQANEILVDRENDIAEMQARLDEMADQSGAIASRDGEIARLRGELASLRETLAERERDIIRARAGMEQARLDWQKQSQAQFAQALSEWKKGEAARILAAESQSQEQSEVALARMSQRLKQAEQELKDSRAQAEALRQRGDADDVRKLRREFGHLQAMLAERDTEIAQLRLDSEHARERWTAEARTSLQKAEHDWKAEAVEAERQKARAFSMRRTARDVVLAASLSVVAVMAYLHFDLASVVNLWPPLANWVDAAPPVAKASQPAQTAPVAAQPMATVLRAANVRSAPSKTAGIIATLARDADVPVLEHRGNWERVKITAAHKDQEGWVYTTYLKPKAVTASAPALQKHT
jgi:hypothetical protein